MIQIGRNNTLNHLKQRIAVLPFEFLKMKSDRFMKKTQVFA
jgi:hypothetical protein